MQRIIFTGRRAKELRFLRLYSFYRLRVGNRFVSLLVIPQIKIGLSLCWNVVLFYGRLSSSKLVRTPQSLRPNRPIYLMESERLDLDLGL